MTDKLAQPSMPVHLTEIEAGQSGGLTVITYPHHELHEGQMFSYSYRSPDATPIADNGTIIVALTTGSNQLHLVWFASAGGDMELEILEGATIADGSVVSAPNHNRNSAKLAPAVVTLNPTVSADGTRLDHAYIPGGTGGNAGGGSANRSNEWVLLPGTTYALRATNRAGSNKPMGVYLSFYEHNT